MNTGNFSEDVKRLNPDLMHDQVYQLKSAISKPKSNLPIGFDSLLEVDFDAELTARGLQHIIHPFTYYLPGMVTYTPDFIAWYSRTDENGIRFMSAPTVYEVKGEHVKNTRDSRTRFRIAAGLHPYMKFVWVTRTPAGRWIEKVYRP